MKTEEVPQEEGTDLMSIMIAGVTTDPCMKTRALGIRITDTGILQDQTVDTMKTGLPATDMGTPRIIMMIILTIRENSLLRDMVDQDLFTGLEVFPSMTFCIMILTFTH